MYYVRWGEKGGSFNDHSVKWEGGSVKMNTTLHKGGMVYYIKRYRVFLLPGPPLNLLSVGR